MIPLMTIENLESPSKLNQSEMTKKPNDQLKVIITNFQMT